MKHLDIELYIERFLDGETTLEEERMLYEFFNNEDVPEKLLVYKDMFAGFAAISNAERNVKKVKPVYKLRFIRTVSVVAACLAGFVLLYPILMDDEADKGEKVRPQENAEQLIGSYSGFDGNNIAESDMDGDYSVMSPRNMDNLIDNMAEYYNVVPFGLMSFVDERMFDGTVYVFPDKKKHDIIRNLYAAVISFSDSMHDKLISYNEEDLIFEQDDEICGQITRHIWVAKRCNGRVYVYRTKCLHSERISLKNFFAFIGTIEKDQIIRYC